MALGGGNKTLQYSLEMLNIFQYSLKVDTNKPKAMDSCSTFTALSRDFMQTDLNN